MTKKESRTTQRRRTDKKASASASSKLLAAVSLLGVSLGVSAAVPTDGIGPAGSREKAAAGEKLAQKKSVEPPLAPTTKTLQSRQHKDQSNQLKLRPVESNQLKMMPRGRR